MPQVNGHKTDVQLGEAARRVRKADRAAGSLTGRWLPQLDFVSLRIYDPGKLAEIRVIDFVEDVATFRFERSDQCVKIFNAVVDHEQRWAWRKLIAFRCGN